MTGWLLIAAALVAWFAIDLLIARVVGRAIELGTSDPVVPHRARRTPPVGRAYGAAPDVSFSPASGAAPSSPEDQR